MVKGKPHPYITLTTPTRVLIIIGKGSSSLDLGQAFIHCNGSSRRIDIDGENQVLHLKVREKELASSRTGPNWMKLSNSFLNLLAVGLSTTGILS